MPRKESSFDISLQSAEALAGIIAATRGAPKARVWVPGRGGAIRVYIGDVGYFTVERTGVSGHNPTPLSQRLTMPMQGLYPSQRKALQQALRVYREEYVPSALEQADRLDEAEAENTRRTVMDAVVALSKERPTTAREVSEFTGIPLISVYRLVRQLHDERELYARNLGTDQERISS